MALQEALIVLSLLGCDDTGTQCHYLKASDQRFETVEACSAASDAFLAASHEEDYPAVVAVCAPAIADEGRPAEPQAPAEAVADAAAIGPANADTAPVDVTEKGFLARVAAAVADVVPERETISKPIDAAATGAMKIGNAVIVGVERAAKAVNPF